MVSQNARRMLSAANVHAYYGPNQPLAIKRSSLGTHQQFFRQRGTGIKRCHALAGKKGGIVIEADGLQPFTNCLRRLGRHGWQARRASKGRVCAIWKATGWLLKCRQHNAQLGILLTCTHALRSLHPISPIHRWRHVENHLSLSSPLFPLPCFLLVSPRPLFPMFSFLGMAVCP